MENKIKEANVEMDVDTFNKVRGKLKPTDKVKLVDKGQTPVMEDDNVEAVIEPKDTETIKYLSNVKDMKSGEVSKPFSISGKKYQMIRGIKPSKEVVMAVYCYDDKNENGENVIHSIEHFDKTIASPMKEMSNEPVKENGFDYSKEEVGFHDKENLMNFLNLVGLEGYKHFFVDKRTGEVKQKFKNIKDMVNSNLKLNPEETYVDDKGLKKLRFGGYFNGDVNEGGEEAGNQAGNNLSPNDANTDIPKLQSDVKKLTGMIKTKFATMLSKLDKPIEQAQFLTAMAAEIGVPLNKLSTIINSYKDISKQGGLDTTSGLNESKIIKKKELTGLSNKKNIINVIKIKDIK